MRYCDPIILSVILCTVLGLRNVTPYLGFLRV